MTQRLLQTVRDVNEGVDAPAVDSDAEGDAEGDDADGGADGGAGGGAAAAAAPAGIRGAGGAASSSRGSSGGGAARDTRSADIVAGGSLLLSGQKRFYDEVDEDSMTDAGNVALRTVQLMHPEMRAAPAGASAIDFAMQSLLPSGVCQLVSEYWRNIPAASRRLAGAGQVLKDFIDAHSQYIGADMRTPKQKKQARGSCHTSGTAVADAIEVGSSSSPSQEGEDWRLQSLE